MMETKTTMKTKRFSNMIVLVTSHASFAVETLQGASKCGVLVFAVVALHPLFKFPLLSWGSINLLEDT